MRKSLKFVTQVTERACERRSLDAIQVVIDQGLVCVEIDDNALVEVAPQDQQWDLVAVLSKSLPSPHNELAHREVRS